MSRARSTARTASRRPAHRLDEVEVVGIALNVVESALHARAVHLSPDERERAARFRFGRDRRRFIACRGALRALIGERLAVDPSTIEFAYGPHGRPELAGPHVGKVAFNVSHSEEVALCALAAEGPLGVDVERVREFPDLDSVTSSYFSSGECAWIDEGEPAARAERFFRLWTVKEAWLKAECDGLAGPLTEIEVLPGSDGNPRVRALRPDGPDVSGWRLRSFRPAPGFIAALATRRSARVALRDWSD